MTVELKNPYRSSKDKPWMRKSWVVFLDILGFSSRVLKATADGTADGLLDKLNQALEEAKRDLIPNANFYARVGIQKAPYVVKLFTDNIVLGFPIHDDGESEFGRMISIVSLYQFVLTRHGFFIRGGITAGELYMDEDIVFGKGILDAHEAESKLARDPRVVLGPEALNLVLHHLTYYGSVSDAPHNSDLLVDSDGQLFVNYLASPIDGADDLSEEFLKELGDHGNLIRNCLGAFASDPKVWPKYAWAGAYHNFFCSKFASASKLAIDLSLLSQAPRQLDEVYRREGHTIYRGEQKVAHFKSLMEWKVDKEPQE